MGEYCIAETAETGLTRFSPKAKRLVLVASISENYAGVYPVSRQFSQDSEIVNVFSDARKCYLVTRCGLFTVPLSKLKPLGFRQDIYRHYEKDIVAWKAQFLVWLRAAPGKGSRLSVPIQELQPLPTDKEIFQEETKVEPSLSEFEEWFFKPDKKKVDTSKLITSNPFDTPELRQMMKEKTPKPVPKAKPVPRQLTDKELFEQALQQDSYMLDQKRYEK